VSYAIEVFKDTSIDSYNLVRSISCSLLLVAVSCAVIAYVAVFSCGVPISTVVLAINSIGFVRT
jgi:hypothetical protein